MTHFRLPLVDEALAAHLLFPWPIVRPTVDGLDISCYGRSIYKRVVVRCSWFYRLDVEIPQFTIHLRLGPRSHSPVSRIPLRTKNPARGCHRLESPRQGILDRPTSTAGGRNCLHFSPSRFAAPLKVLQSEVLISSGGN